MCDLTNPIFTDEVAAVAHMEADRWPVEVSCPMCGAVGQATKMGGKTQAGMFLCNACRGKFTVRTGTIFERSHIPLHKWLLATHLMASSKKGISAHQLHRMLGITYKSAWFMAHRIREAMKPSDGDGPLGGPDKVVEADELYTGRRKGVTPKTGGSFHKMTVVSLVERGGRARSFHIAGPDAITIGTLVNENVADGSRIHTDESPLYSRVKRTMKREKVNHGRKEYARGDVTTNSVEGYFSVFERGLVGVYQHVGEQHLKRYLAEFDFRQSNRAKLGVDDATRAARILKGAKGRRLTYRQVA
jgi:transposase-like protein